MQSNQRTSKSKSLAIAAVLLIIGLGCLCLPSGLITTPTPTQKPTPTQPPTQPPAPPPTPPPLPPTPPPTSTLFTGGGQLTAGGPWLLIETSQGLWAVNADGSGLTQLTTVDYWHGQIQAAVQPGGHEIAFLTPGNFDLHHLSLNLISLPQGNTSRLIELTSAQTEAYADSGPGDPGFEALRAIGEGRSFAWSPDGNKLAFIGAMDGPSADLYLFDQSLMQIKRVSQDEDQDFSPSWSPDGEHLLYLEAKGFGTGAGGVMSGVWVADGDGSNATRLYRTSSAGEDIDGWLDNTTALLDTWNVSCGFGNLRLFDVVSQTQTVLSQGCVSSAAATGFRNAAMFSNDTGTYLLTAEARTPVRVSPEKNALIHPWGPDDYVFRVHFSSGQIATFGAGTYDTQISPVTAAASTNLPFDEQDVAMYGAIWGWTSQNHNQPGAWITGPGLEIGRIYDAPARFPAWSPDNNLLFFAQLEGGYDLYIITFDSHYTDLHVVNHLDADINSVVWLGPR